MCVLAETQELMSFVCSFFWEGGEGEEEGVPVCHLHFKKWVKKLSGVFPYTKLPNIIHL